MIKVFLKDSATYGLANILTRGISFLMLPIYTAFLSPAKFGILDLLIVSGTILTAVIGLEIHQAVARYFPEAESEDDQRKIVSTALWATIVLNFLVLAPAFFLAEEMSALFFGNKEYSQVLQLAMVSYGFNFVYFFTSSQLRWQLKAKTNLLVSAVYSALTGVIAYVGLKYFALDIAAIFLAQIAASVIATALSVACAAKFYRFIADPAVFRQLLVFSLPLVLSTLSVYAMLYVDRLLITAYLEIADLGLYGYAYRIASLVGLITTSSQTALTPLIYSKFRDPKAPKEIAKLFNYAVGSAAAGILILFVLSDFIVTLLAPPEYLGAAPLIPWIAASIVFSGVTSFTPGIFIAKKTHLVLYINAASFVLNLVLCYVLIRAVGLMGAVYSTALSSLCYFLMYYYVGQRYFFIPFFWASARK